MNLSFALIAALMAGVALAFVLWPLLRKDARGTPVVLAMALALVLPATALGLYAWVGTPAALDPDAITAQPTQQIDLHAALANLQARLAQTPDNLEGWLLLGRARQAMQQPRKAAQAYAQALQLAPDNPDVLVASAEASSLDKPDHQIDEQARGYLVKALRIDPKHQRALWLLGISDFQRGHFEQAARTWQKLFALLDGKANAKVAAAVQQQIARAEAAASSADDSGNTAPATSAGGASPAMHHQASIKIHISLAADLRGRTRADARVFVYARAVGGPLMPLAVKRLTVADLPATVTLTDAMAMSPQLKLSLFAKVNVSARVSNSGQASPQAGDLEARTMAWNRQDQNPLMLEINTVRK